jgi:hypothetical protein
MGPPQVVDFALVTIVFFRWPGPLSILALAFALALATSAAAGGPNGEPPRVFRLEEQVLHATKARVRARDASLDSALTRLRADMQKAMEAGRRSRRGRRRTWRLCCATRPSSIASHATRRWPSPGPGRTIGCTCCVTTRRHTHPHSARKRSRAPSAGTRLIIGLGPEPSAH